MGGPTVLLRYIKKEEEGVERQKRKRGSDQSRGLSEADACGKEQKNSKEKGRQTK